LRIVLSQDGIAIWNLGPDKQPARITATDQVAAIKTDPRNGYNFFAYKRPSPWSSVFADSAVSEEIS
jgi:hypothetical protein